jgi:very-short-patch-repair endonuclease
MQAVGGRYHIAWKVRMADVLWVPGGTSNRQRHLNRIFAKHLDFVLCHPETSAPVLAIELDDSSHRESRRRERDSFVDAALDAADLPLLRIPVRRSYDPRELADLIALQFG